MSEFIKKPLFEKRVVFDGDSICQGCPKEDRTPWANIIGERNSMQWKNYGVGGGTVTAEVYVESTGAARHWVSRCIDRIKAENPELDYLILEGGTNDADLFKNEPCRLGGFAPEDFSGNYDDTTFTGALESLFFKAISYYPLAKIGYIVAPKMVGVDGSYIPAARRRRYFDRAVEICKKWGIPCLDLWENCQLNPALKCYFDPSVTVAENIAAGRAYMDGQHLTAVGYEFVSTAIESWMRSL